MTRAAIYLRISKDQTGEALGVSRQLEDCREHARMLGWDVAEVYTDNDVSATSGKQRPAYQRMLADASAGDVEAIVAWHADRLYRKVTDLGDLVDVCKASNVQIATVRAGTIDLTTPTGRLVAGLLAQVATYEGEAKSDRWKRAWRQGREAGKVSKTGSRMFGYSPAMEVIPEEAEVARRMARDVLDGASIMSIVRWLDDEGHTATRGRAWRPATIKQYLTNPRIAGWSTLGREIVAEGTWEPLLDRETWEAVRALLSARTRSYVPRKALLNGLIRCSECGTRLITGSARGYRTYRCPDRPDLKGCGRVAGKAESIEWLVEQAAAAALMSEDVRKRVAEIRTEPSTTQSELADLELRKRELEQQLDQPGVPVPTILRAIERTQERVEALSRQLAASPRVSLPDQGSPWPTDLKVRRALVDLVLAEVTLSPARKGANRFEPERVSITPR